MSVHTVGIGSTLRRGPGSHRGVTLAELEAELRRCRKMGAPDDAVVAPTAPGSIYIGEVIWVGEARP